MSGQPAKPLVRLLLASAALSMLGACEDPNFGAAETRRTTAVERVSTLRQKLRSQPNDAQSLSEIGKIYADQGLWVESMGAYREALIVSPASRGNMLGYGRAQLALGDYASAYETAKKAGGSDTESLLLKSGALAGLGQLADARRILDQAQKQNPRDLDVRSNIGLVAALMRDPQAYGIARAAAFAPDAQYSHIRNMVLVGGIAGMDAVATDDGERRGMERAEIGSILTVGRRARSQGMRAFTVLTR